ELEWQTLAGEDPFGHAIAQAIEGLVDPPGRLAPPEHQQVGEDVMLEEARIEIAEHRERSASSNRPDATFGAVLFERDRLEGVDRAARGREHVAGAGVGLLGSLG